MITIEITGLPKAAPTQHSQRCTATKLAIDAGRSPAAACGLRHAATHAQDWATQARQLADWCDAQAMSPQAEQLAPSGSGGLPTPNGTAPLEALEAGLMALASGLGPDHSARVLQAISGATQPTPIATSLPAEAVVIGQALDHDSLEQGEPA